MWQYILGVFVSSKPLLAAYIGWPLLTAVLSVVIRRRLPEKWEAWALKYPKLAFFVELSKAWGLNLPKVVVLGHRYAQRMSGQVPEDAYKLSTLPEPLKAALQDPQNRKRLEEIVASWTTTSGGTSLSTTPSDREVPKAVEPARPERPADQG